MFVTDSLKLRLLVNYRYPLPLYKKIINLDFRVFLVIIVSTNQLVQFFLVRYLHNSNQADFPPSARPWLC